MAIPNATLTFKEGQLPTPPEQSDNTIAVLGFSTLGTALQPYTFDGAAPADVVATIGYGIGPQFVAGLVTTPNHGKVVFLPLNFTAGVLSAVTSAGTTPPAVTLTGNSVDDVVGRVEILSAGARGVATFRYALDYDATAGTAVWSNPILTAATVALDNSGIVLNFPIGTYAVDNVYSFTGAAPTHSDAQIQAGFDALQSSGLDIGGVYVLSTPGGALDTDRATALATTFAAVTTKVDALEATAYKYIWCVLQAGAPVAATTGGLATWRSALSSATMQALAHKRMGIAAGMAKQSSVIDGRAYRRNVGWRICERLSISEISEHLGRVDSGPVRTLLAVDHDEAMTGGLADGTAGQRYLTLRTWSGYSGYYVADTHTFASVGSDYSKFERLRVVNRGAKVGRNALVRKIGDSTIVDSATGRILESEALNLDSEMTGELVSALIAAPTKTGKGHASSVSAKVSRTDDILTTSTLSGQFAIQPLGYFRQINFTIGFTRSNVPAAS